MKTTIAATMTIILSGCGGSDFISSSVNNNDSGSDGVFSDTLINDTQTQDVMDSGIENNEQETSNNDVEQDNNTDVTNNDTFISCDVSNCSKPEHGTSFCNQNNECDVQCINGCTKNGLTCDCPKSECCPDPNHNIDNPQCDGKQSGRCVNGICQFDGYEADTSSCTAYCTTCMNKEFDHIYVAVAGPPPISYCECKP